MNEMIILRERVITISPGDTFDQNLQGNVLRVTAGRVPLRIRDRNQQMDFSLLAGERAEFPGEFPGLILSHGSGVDETFTIQVGKGVNVASAILSGAVTISGTPTVNIAENQFVTNKPMEADRNFNLWGTAIAANSTTTLLSPGANVNGCYLLRASASVVSLSDLFTYLKMENAGGTVTNYIAIGLHCGGSKTQMFNVEQPVYIPPNMGVFYYTSQLTIAAASGLSAIFKML